MSEKTRRVAAGDSNKGCLQDAIDNAVQKAYNETQERIKDGSVDWNLVSISGHAHGKDGSRTLKVEINY